MILKKILAATAVGAFLGGIVGTMYALSMGDFWGGVGMFLGMMGFVYGAGLMLELIFYLNEWIDR